MVGKNWRGGRTKDRDYWYIWKPEHPYATQTGYVLEHRLVMEQHIGRYLEPTEVVHHINKDKSDNRIENLQLFDSHSKHVSFELTGHEVSAETRYKLSQTHRGKPTWIKGKKMTREHRLKISEANKKWWSLHAITPE